MKTLFPWAAAIWMLVVANAGAATLTLTNYTAAANAVHGIGDKEGARIGSSQGAGVIGRMASLSDAQIEAAVAVGDIATLVADFQAFDPVGGIFGLNSLGTDGAFEQSLSHDTRASVNAFGGAPIFVWLYKGASRSEASQYWLARVSSVFPTDAEDLPPAGPVDVAVRPGNIDKLFAGTIGPETYDYGLGGGAVTLLKMKSITANQAPVAQSKSVRVALGVARAGQVIATDADLDALTFSLVTDVTQGALTFNSDGSFSYTANPDATGRDSFTFMANDGKLDSNTATVTINIGDFGYLAQTLSFPQPAQRTRTDAAFNLSATATSGLPVTFQILSGPATLSGSTVTLTGAVGTVYVLASQPGNDEYEAAPSVESYFHVTATATIPTLGHLSQVYRGTPLTVSLAGLPGGQTFSVTYNGSPTAPTNAGTYSVVATTSVGVTKRGSLIISKAPLSVVADNKSRLIGEENPPLTFSYLGFRGTDTAETVFPQPDTRTVKRPVISTTATWKSPGGTYPIRLTGGLALNYALTYVPGLLTVNTFAGSYEILAADPTTQAPAVKVELTIATAVAEVKNEPAVKSMTCSGKLWVPGEMAFVAFSGSLKIDPVQSTASNVCTVVRKVGTMTTTYALDLTVTLTGNLSLTLQRDSAIIASGNDGRILFVPPAKPVISYAGDHTAILAPGTLVGAASGSLPEGSGYATAKLDAKAVMAFAGKLADGTAITASLKPTITTGVNAVSYRLFVLPYVARKDSYVAGWINMVPHPDLTGRYYVPSGPDAFLVWAKAGKSTDKSYRSGIPMLSCSLTLDPWRKPARATTSTAAIVLRQTLRLGVTGDFLVAHSSFTSPSAADLPTGLQLIETPTVKVTVTADVANLTGWKITSLNTITGVFAGECTLKKEAKLRKLTFSGVLRQPTIAEAPGIIGRGFFLLPPVVATDPTVSGEIRFSRP
jgi:VCBS repeat-containing protein